MSFTNKNQETQSYFIWLLPEQRWVFRWSCLHQKVIAFICFSPSSHVAQSSSCTKSEYLVKMPNTRRSIICSRLCRKCHLICFWFMMSYLLFFRTLHLFNLPIPPSHTNMIQMILTLKIIGLAFERNAVFIKTRDADKNDNGITLTAAERDIQDISVLSMFHYCFNYIGLLTGNCLKFKLSEVHNFVRFRSILHLQDFLWFLQLSVRNQRRHLESNSW